MRAIKTETLKFNFEIDYIQEDEFETKEESPKNHREEALAFLEEMEKHAND